MSKYYARELRDWYDTDVYYGEDDAIADNIYIGGNKHFKSFNQSLYDDVIAICNTLCDLSDLTVERVQQELTDCLQKEDGSAITEAEATMIYNMVSNIYLVGGDTNPLMLALLEIKYGEKFGVRSICGCSQGDWQYCIYPHSKMDIIDYIAAVYFNTGTEFAVTDGPIDSMNDFDQTEHVTYYTDQHGFDAIKADLANQIGIPVDQLVLQMISDEHTVTTYEYTEY